MVQQMDLGTTSKTCKSSLFFLKIAIDLIFSAVLSDRADLFGSRKLKFFSLDPCGWNTQRVGALIYCNPLL